MTREQLEEIKKLVEEATPGPYQVASIYPAYGVFRVEVDEPSECVAMCAVSMNEDADEPHVERQEAHARNGTNARAIAALLKYALPLVEALEWQSAMTKALSESQERLAKEVKDARAELGEALDELAFIKEEYGDGDSAEMSEDALMLKIRVQSAALDDLEQERARLAADVERLREVVRQVHGLADDAVRGAAVWEPLVEIHKITKGMSE